jgi:O-antigen/teichoic acid export membrane protein
MTTVGARRGRAGEQPPAREPGPPEGARGLWGRAASGIVWTTAQKWIVRIGGFATIAVLTRQLDPADFGIVAVATSIMPVVYLLSDLGFSAYIVQVKEADDRLISTAFWYSTSAGVLLGGLLVLGAPLLSALFHLPSLTSVLLGIAPAVVFGACASVPMALLRRRLEFRLLALQGGIAALVGQVVAIVMALTGFGVWALVGQLVVVQFLMLGLAWISARWRPRAQFSRHEFMTMAHFGANVVGVDVISLIRLWIENAIVVAVAGATGLGYLNIAQRLIQVTQDLTASAIVPVSTVVFAKIRESAEELRSGYLRALELSYIVIMPVMIFITVGAPQIVPIVFGGGWDASIWPARWLAIAGVLTLGAMLDHGLFYGLGRPGRWLVYSAAIDGLTAATTVALIWFGISTVALGFVGVALIATVVRWFMVARLLGLSTWAVARPFVTTALAGTGAAFAGIDVAELARLNGGLPDLLLLALEGIAIVLVHLGLLRLLAPASFRAGLDLLRNRVLRRRQVTTASGPASEGENTR